MSWTSPRVIRGNRGDIASRYFMLKAALAHGVVVSSVFATRASHLPDVLHDRIVPYGWVYNAIPGLAGLRALSRARHVIWTGGLDLQDDSSLVKLIHTSLVFLSYRLLGLRILLAHQGAGPIQSPIGRWLARRVLGCVRLALVRDEGSARLLRGLMPPERVRFAADGIFLGASPAPQPRHPLIEAGGRPVIGVNVRLWFHFTGSWVPYQLAGERYRKRAQARMNELLAAFAAVVRHLRTAHDARVVLVSMYEPGIEPWEDDLGLLEQLKTAFPDDPEVAVLRDDLSIEALCGVFAGFDAMIGTRLHSTLIALRMATPAIHVAYTLKGRDIYADLGLSDWVVDIDSFMQDPGGAAALVDRVLSEGEGARARVSAIVEPLVAANERALAAAIAEMEAG